MCFGVREECSTPFLAVRGSDGTSAFVVFIGNVKGLEEDIHMFQ